MVIKVTKFNDLGKCSFGTLLNEFNSDIDHIYILSKPVDNFNTLDSAFVEVKINDINDLCKFLWSNPFISTNNKYYFTNTIEWWHSRFNSSLERYRNDINKYEKLLLKTTNLKRKEKLEDLISENKNSIKSIEDMLKNLDVKKKELINILEIENKE